MNVITSLDGYRNQNVRSAQASHRQALVIIACDAPETAEQLRSICGFFDLAVEVVPAQADLMGALREHRPMAVISGLDGRHQDGFHAMKVVADYDRDLPILLLTGGDIAMMGAADAVQEMWKLTMVSRSTSLPLAGQLANFLFTAGRRAGCMRLVPL